MGVACHSVDGMPRMRVIFCKEKECFRRDDEAVLIKEILMPKYVKKQGSGPMEGQTGQLTP